MNSRSVRAVLLTAQMAFLAAPAAEGAVRTKVIKVYLADFEDVPHPDRYTPEYFRELFFGLGSPRQTPEGKPLSGSVREYFRELSNGTLDVDGEVAEWVRIPREISKVPHWHRGMKPFGESWPVIVAETLRANGISGDGARDQVRLSDGRRPDLLVFLNTDWGVGGVNRGWGQLRDVLGRMKLSELWDDGWAKLPSPLSSFSATIWRKAPRPGADGTIDKVPPTGELELFPLSIMMHEMGHQLAGWPDLYTPSYAPWGVFDLMGGPAASTHHPMTVSAFLRVRSGWMQFTDLPLTDHPGLVLRPLEEEHAIRLPQGPGQEVLVVENRRELHYPRDYSQPPEDRGQRLLVYRVDPAGRCRAMSGGRPVKRLTTIVRRGGSYGEVWGAPDHRELSAGSRPSSRNALGELWWELLNIAPQPDRAVTFDARCRATDLSAQMRAGTGAFDLPATGPHRVYLNAEVPGGVEPAEIRIGDVTARLTRSGDVVADLPADARSLAWSMGDGVTVKEAWLVGLPDTVNALDAAETLPAGQTVLLADGRWYGPAVRPLDLEAGRAWHGEWPVPLPEGETILRGLLGWAASSADGAQATVDIKLVVGEREWPLVTGLQLSRGKGDDNLPVVLELALPNDSRGQAARIQLDVTGTGDSHGELALAAWRLTR